MTKVIAVAGKGGTGKTTLSSLIIRSLVKNEKTPVLAVDADPNSNLGETLGLKVEKTIGDVTIKKECMGHNSLSKPSINHSFLHMVTCKVCWLE